MLLSAVLCLIPFQRPIPPVVDPSRQFDVLEKLMQQAREEDLRQKIERELALKAYITACRNLEQDIASGLQILLETPEMELNVKREVLRKKVIHAMDVFLKNCNPHVKKEKKENSPK